MKVLCVNATLDPIAGGGTAERTYHLSRHLALAGFPCSVLTLDLGLTEERIAALAPAQVTALHCISPRFFLFRLPDARIGRLVAQADVIHVMGHWTVLNALVCNEARRQGKPYVVCPAGALPIFGRSRWLKRTYNRMAGIKSIQHASAWVAIAENEFEHFFAYGIPGNRVTLIPNGIDPAEFTSSNDRAFRTKFALPEGVFILFMGRLNLIKGPDLLLEAFAHVHRKFPDVRLVFAGPDGGLLERLRSSVKTFALADKVHFIGPVSGEDKSNAYHSAGLLVIPSRQEAMSIVVLEGGICGTPALMTDRCGFNEIAQTGGGVVVPATAEGLSKGLERLLEAPEQLVEMGKKLRRFASERFVWSTIIAEYLRLFEKVAPSDKR